MQLECVTQAHWIYGREYPKQKQKKEKIQEKLFLS